MSAGHGMDRLRLDVFHHLFAAVAEEMGATLMRSSFSPNIRERRDFSCAIFDGRGRMIGQASHLPVHLGSTPLSVAAAIERIDMQPGDAVILNDPYAGGTHLPDITFVSPVFLRGSERPDFFCANRAHHADVGGAEPGSMAPSRDVHGEGIRIPPVRLVRAGQVDREVLALILANMRVASEREGDLLAQWSTNGVGERRLLEMTREYGASQVLARAGQLMDWTETLTRELLRGLPDGTWSFEDELEDGDEVAEHARIRLQLTKRGDALECDFRATDKRPGSSSNATRAVTISAVFYALRLLLPDGTPTNDGILRPVTVLTEPGTLVDARYPSGVAAGNVETSQRIVDVLLGCLGQLMPDAIPAASSGTMSNFTFGGPVQEGDGDERRPAYVYYETIAGGAGAGPGGPGAHATQTHMTNTRNTPIEELEMAYPVRLLSCGVRRGSGGAGGRRGGDGVEKSLLFLEPAHVSFVGERQERGPWGAQGGAPGRSGSIRIRTRGSRTWRRCPGRVTRTLSAGSLVEIRTPGGGGYGAAKAGPDAASTGSSRVSS